VRDLDLNILFWNTGAEKIYGWTAPEVVGTRNVFKESPKQFDAARQTVISNGEWHGEFRQTRRDCAEINVESRWTLVRDER
ncbi:PAS domain-containing protein, partial [Rhizobium ruizarguesonis]